MLTLEVAHVIVAIVVVVVLIAAAALISWKSAINYHIKVGEAKVGSAEEKAREIIDDALKTAETKKREALLEAKEENLKAKNDLEKETKERRAEIQRYEKRVLGKEETLDKKLDALEKRESKLNSREANFEKEKEKVAELRQSHLRELEKISGLTSEQAKEYLLKTVEEDVKHETAVLVKELERQAKDEANKKAKDYVVTAIQKCAADHVSETTISVVPLPSDEMKGRIIGREGRNIRTLENLTGIDLIIDDTPDSVVISCFDPIRREIARRTLEILVTDGRIQPPRIEEVYSKCTKELENEIREEGEKAVFETGIGKIHPELIKLIGRLRFRTSYGQNALAHSKEVAFLAGKLAVEIGEDEILARRAGLLHDIGKSTDHEQEGSHVDIGVEIATKFRENPIVINAIASHHGDVEADNVISHLVAAADTLSAARPGARSESLDNYIKRLQQLEELSNEFKGVDKTYALQAGREVRIIVKPEEITDAEAYKLARDIKNKIETTMNYPGTIKVTVIRETRVQEVAR